MADSIIRDVELIAVSALKPHPRNYRAHPDDQLEHLGESLKEHGLYRNVVIAQDGTILAGHGVVEAARRVGLEEVNAVRLPIDPESPAALKVLTGDNEIEHLAEQDDRLLSELLKEISESDPLALLGTGYDEHMLANLVFVTRPASEIRDFDEAAHWVGMPEHGEGPETVKLIISFESEADRGRLMELIGASVIKKATGESWSIWWPEKEREELSHVRFETADV